MLTLYVDILKASLWESHCKLL